MVTRGFEDERLTTVSLDAVPDIVTVPVNPPPAVTIEGDVTRIEGRIAPSRFVRKFGAAIAQVSAAKQSMTKRLREMFIASMVR